MCETLSNFVEGEIMNYVLRYVSDCWSTESYLVVGYFWQLCLAKDYPRIYYFPGKFKWQLICQTVAICWSRCQDLYHEPMLSQVRSEVHDDNKWITK